MAMNESADTSVHDPVWVKVAAADSPAEAKAAADFVCSGEHDEATIQRAIDLCAGGTRNLFLYDGIYNIDAFREWGDGQELRLRQATGESILGMILRLEAVKRKLSETNMAIGQVTASCGFRSELRAKHLFKERFGCSMREWRAKNKK